MVRLSAVRVPSHSSDAEATCRPSPCSRLSRPLTPLAAPLPSGARPVGHPPFRTHSTYRAQGGCLVRPLTPGLSWVLAQPKACGGPYVWPSLLSTAGMGVVISGHGQTAEGWASSSFAFTMLRGSCRTTTYTPSVLSCFPDMLLAASPFGLTLVRWPLGIPPNLARLSRVSNAPLKGAP